METRSVNQKILSLLLAVFLLLTVFPLTAYASPEVTTTSLPNATIGTAYSQTLGASGFATPTDVQWSKESGDLPPGLSLTASSGLISGTPDATANTSSPYTFTVKATSGEESDTQSLSITVNAAPPAENDTPPALLDDTWEFYVNDPAWGTGKRVTAGTGTYAGARVVSITDNADGGQTYTTGFTYELDYYGAGVDRFRVKEAIREIITARGLTTEDGNNTINLTATFDKNGGTTTFTVTLIEGLYLITFNANGGVGPNNTETVAEVYTYSDGTLPVSLSSIRTPTRSGYTFNGWFTERSGGTRLTDGYAFATNSTVYAQWNAIVSVSDNDDDDDDSSSGGSGGGSSTTTSTPASGSSPSNPQSLTSTGSSTTSLINNAVEKAIDNAGSSTGSITPRFENVSEVSASVLEAIEKAAGGRDTTILFDSMNGNTVDVRVYIDPASITGNINVSASTLNASARASESIFEKYFDNNVAVVSLGQKGSFGANVNIAAKVDLTGMNTANLVFYSYDPSTNNYSRIPSANYFVDSKGYLHFTTSVGGNVIVSNGSLIKK